MSVSVDRLVEAKGKPGSGGLMMAAGELNSPSK